MTNAELGSAGRKFFRETYADDGPHHGFVGDDAEGVKLIDGSGKLRDAFFDSFRLTAVPAVREFDKMNFFVAHQGKVADEQEVVVMLKTRRERLPALKRAVDELHPYDVPELLAVPVEDGSRAFLAWLTAETTPTLAAVPRGD